jgi:hypothetical protein
MITRFTANGRLILDVPPKGFKYNQDHSIDNILPDLNQVRTGNGRHKVTTTLMMHMDNSMCHNRAKITKKMPFKGMERARHPAH